MELWLWVKICFGILPKWKNEVILKIKTKSNSSRSICVQPHSSECDSDVPLWCCHGGSFTRRNHGSDFPAAIRVHQCHPGSTGSDELWPNGWPVDQTRRGHLLSQRYVRGNLHLWSWLWVWKTVELAFLKKQLIRLINSKQHKYYCMFRSWFCDLLITIHHVFIWATFGSNFNKCKSAQEENKAHA